jgi:hypothetical protein
MSPLAPEGYDPLEHERPFWEPIGRFVFNFGYLERDVDWALSVLLKLEYFAEGQTVFGQIRNLSGRILLLGALCNRSTKNPDYRAEIKSISKGLIEANAFRNRLVHGAWAGCFVFPEKPPEERLEWQKNGINPNSLKFSHTQISIKEINAQYRAVMTLKAAVKNLAQKIAAERTASAPPTPSDDTSQPAISQGE